MKAVVSIPDELFRRAEALAQRHGKSRSQIYREALSEYVSRREPQAVTNAISKVVDEVDDETDPWVVEAGRRVLERSDW